MGRRAERWLDRRQLLQPINCNSTHCLYKTFAPCPTQDFLRLPHTTLDGSGWTTDAHDDRSYAETAQAKNSVDATDDREMRLCCPKGEVCEVIQELRFGVEDGIETNKRRTVMSRTLAGYLSKDKHLSSVWSSKRPFWPSRDVSARQIRVHASSRCDGFGIRLTAAKNSFARSNGQICGRLALTTLRVLSGL
ncbi:uncharacterized protein BKA78DRAFT_129734 [Phyllosticta capitalensis]|uniref:uncharacterized protein n=1 Tax=Phyllosticta capitalensis TaxID=121624 RepID=UPI003130F3A2